jgi:hypothetical protein
MATFSIFARQDSITAQNSTLNPIGTNQAPTTTLTFTDNGSGDLSLEWNGGLPDPDTQVIIGGTPYDFTVLLTGVLPGNSQVPESLVGRTVALIEVTVDGERQQYFFVLGEPPATFEEMDAVGNGAIPLSLIDLDPPPFCFAPGALIQTPRGVRAVETLAAGDLVLTEDGQSVPIAWIGRSSYSAARARREERLRPVHLRPHAFGPGLPDRELVLSPQHRVVVEGPVCQLLFGLERAFVIARHLPDHMAETPDPESDVVYFHILLSGHKILLANGLPCESLQPSRRMIEALSAEAQASLLAAIAGLGPEEMLTRPDALPTLTHREAHVLFAAQGPAARPVGHTFARAGLPH